MLDEFDAAVVLGIEGRNKHMGATARLRLLATEIARTVRVMNGRNRVRFESDGQELALVARRERGAGYAAWQFARDAGPAPG